MSVVRLERAYGDYGALDFPWVLVTDAATNGTRPAPPSDLGAGVFARTDQRRAMWRAPADTEAGLSGVQGLRVVLTDAKQDSLNPEGVNALRVFPSIGPVVWRARTLGPER